MDRERLFTVMLVATVVMSCVLGGLVVADLTYGHREVAATGLAGGAAGSGAGGPGTTPAAPGAQGSRASASRTAAAPGRGAAAGAGRGGGAGAPAIPNQGVGNGCILTGSIITQTGPGRSTTMAHAVTAWARSVNQRGGIDGYRICLDLRDDQGNADVGASEYRTFAQDEHVFAMLAECAPVTDDQEVSYIDQQQLLLVGDCLAPQGEYANPYVWLAGPNPTQNGELGARLMLGVEHWPASGGQVALVCLNQASVEATCSGAQQGFGSGALWHGGPQMEQITDNNYAQLIAQWQAQGVRAVDLVLDPSSVQRYLYAAQNAGWNAPVFNGLVIDSGIASFQNANGMLMGTAWTPLDQNTAGMQRLAQTLQTYYPDDRVDVYAQTGWVSCLIYEHAIQLMGANVSRQNLVATLNAIRGWDTGLGPVESYSPQSHDGQVENALMQLRNAGTAGWQLVGIHGPVGL